LPNELKTKYSFLTLLPMAASGVAMTIALVVIGAWWADDLTIASVAPSYVPMTFSIALSVLLLGGAILARMRLPVSSATVWIPTGIALTALLLSCWVMFEFLANHEYGIDRLLGAESVVTDGYEPAQPSPISIFTLLTASVAAVMSFNEHAASKWSLIIVALSMYVFSVGLLITLGYAYGSPLLYGGDVRPVSILAGISFALIGTALVCMQGPYKWPVNAFTGTSVRARLLKSFLPLIVFMVLLSGSVSNRALSTSSNPALTASLIALVTAVIVGFIVTRLSSRIGGQIDRTNAMLLKTEEDLRLANEKLSVLGSITRHDALNRLAVVLGRMEMLQEMSHDKDVVKQTKESLEAAKAIEKIIQFTGEYQKIGAGGQIWLDVEDAFREALMGVDHETITAKSEVTGLEVLADKMFEKVLVNLVDNSMRHGKNLKSLRLHHSMRDGGLVLVYEDDGGGLNAEERANLFKRGHGKHTGLGTFLSKEILEFSGMTIRETGEHGIGARFEIGIPPGKFRMKQ
jgi:signal transduction histidine kinase